ncbi:MAG: YebC/PmpR family DNA-binding transcriptional regulator [Clostridia bacterium]
MSGHSKWANIKHRKERSDAKRGKIFTKIGRELYVAVKSGGPDPDTNSRLKDVIAKAKAANMPNDSITRSIKKASGEGSSEQYENIVYEGYGPGGVAVIVEAMTDNRNRTAADVRHLFDKHGGNLGTTGCVSYLFDRKGVLIIEKQEDIDEEALMLASIEAGADDFSAEQEYYEILCEPGIFSQLRETLENKGYALLEAELQMVPRTMTLLTEKEASSMEKLSDLLEDLDDVQSIYHNWENE